MGEGVIESERKRVNAEFQGWKEDPSFIYHKLDEILITENIHSSAHRFYWSNKSSFAGNWTVLENELREFHHIITHASYLCACSLHTTLISM